MSRVEGLMRVVQERAPGKVDSFLDSAARAGEHELVLDSIAGCVHGNGIPLSASERDELRALLYECQIPVEMMDAINDRENILASLNVIAEEPAVDREVPFRLSESPVVVHEDPDLSSALGAQVGVHLDLPVRWCERFVDHFTQAVGVGAEVNVARTNPDQYMRDGRIHKPSAVEVLFVSEHVRLVARNSVWGGGVLLRGFEQWWVKGRFEAESFLRDVPGLLAMARREGKTFHLGLADLSSSTVEQVREVFARAELPDEVRTLTVPVFQYPPA